MEIDFWAVVGKVGAAVGAVIGVITLWGKVFVKKHKVIFDLDEIDVPTPDLKEALEILLDQAGPDAVVSSSYKIDRGETITRQDLDRVVQEIGSKVAANIFSKIRYEDRLQKQRKLIRLSLENAGKKTAKSIVIDFDFEPVFFESDNEEVSREGKKLKMAELRPGQKVKIDFWLDFLSSGKGRVTHEDHVLQPRSREVAHGWRAILVGTILSPIWIGFWAYALGGLLLGLIVVSGLLELGSESTSLIPRSSP